MLSEMKNCLEGTRALLYFIQFTLGLNTACDVLLRQTVAQIKNIKILHHRPTLHIQNIGKTQNYNAYLHL